MKKAVLISRVLAIVALALLILPEQTLKTRAAQTKFTAGEIPFEEVELVSTWYDARGFEASLIFNNKGPNVVEADITSWNLPGRSFRAETEYIQSNSVARRNLLEWINRAGAGFEQGRVELVYRGMRLEIGSQVVLEDRAKSLIFSEQLIDPSQEFASRRLEGLWWLPARTPI